MNAPLKDYVLITMAMAVIMACGFGLGHLVTSRQAPPPAPTVEAMTFEEETLSALRRALELTPGQERLIRDDLRATAKEVFDTQERAMLEYHLILLRFQDRIGPKLDPDQRKLLRRNGERLQLVIQRRFADLDPDSGPAQGKDTTNHQAPR